MTSSHAAPIECRDRLPPPSARRLARGALGLPAAAACVLAAVMATRDVTAQALPYEQSPFGFHPASVGGGPNPPFRDAQDIGVRWHRPPVYVFWSIVQPDRAVPVYIWSMYDTQFRGVPVGMNILANITVEPTASGYSVPGSYLPVDSIAYLAFVRAAVERYDGDGVADMSGLQVPIRHWQVDNEPNFIRQGSDYARLQAMTHAAIKEACPGCQVLIGGATGFPQGYAESFLANYAPYLAALGGCCVDVFDFHWYGTATGDYRLIAPVLDTIRARLAETGFGDLPIWVTEMGTYSGDPADFPLVPLPYQSEEQQAADLLKRFVYPLSLGVRKVFPAFGLMEGFQHNDGYFDHTGLIYDGSGSGDLGRGVRKLGYYTYRLMTRTLEGSRWTEVRAAAEDTVQKTYVYEFPKDSSPVWVAWWDCYADPTYSPGMSRVVTLSGLQADSALVTEAVPRFATGAEVTDEATAFRREALPVSGGSLQLALGTRPVFVVAADSIVGVGGEQPPGVALQIRALNLVRGDGELRVRLAGMRPGAPITIALLDPAGRTMWRTEAEGCDTACERRWRLERGGARVPAGVYWIMARQQGIGAASDRVLVLP